MSRQPVSADVKTFSKLYTNNQNRYTVKVPSYQREQAWKLDKMEKLWEDMFLHCQRFDCKVSEDPFFIGSIILNNLYSDIDADIVDGQQRITTLTIIASAIRDALISKKRNQIAYEIHEKLLMNMLASEPLFKPLHSLPDPSTGKEFLSSKLKLEPFQNLISPIFSGFKVESQPKGTDNEIAITNEKSEWTGTFSKIYISRDGNFELSLELDANQKFVIGQIGDIKLKEQLGDNAAKISVGDEIWFLPETYWWDIDDDKKADTYDVSGNHFFDADFRNLYILVRRQCQSFITDSQNYIIDPFKSKDVKFEFSSDDEVLLNLPEHIKIIEGELFEAKFPHKYGLNGIKFQISKGWSQKNKTHLKSKLSLEGKFIDSNKDELKVSSFHLKLLHEQVDEWLDDKKIPDVADNIKMYDAPTVKKIKEKINDYKNSNGGAEPSSDELKEIIKDYSYWPNLQKKWQKIITKANKYHSKARENLEWENVSLEISRPKLIQQLAHNDSEDKRVSNLKSLIDCTSMVIIKFDTKEDNSKPVKHFINTNDKSKMSPLETLDLLNAFVNQIVNNPYPIGVQGFQDAESKEIQNIWRNNSDSIWNLIYLKQDKNTSFGSKFFFHYMIASCQFKDDSNRYGEAATYEGIQKVWSKSNKYRKQDGQYNLSYLLTKFKEMQKYAKMYVRIHEPSSFPNSGKTDLARKHVSQLVSIRKTGNTQWIPPYLSILYNYADHENAPAQKRKMDEMCYLFLKNYNMMYLKSEFKKLVDGTRWFATNEEHKRIDGKSGWCQTIHDSIKSQQLNKPLIKKISALPKQIKSGEVEHWDSVNLANPPRKNEKIWNDSVTGSVDSFVWAYEISLAQNGNSFPDCQVEHIVPQSPKKWGPDYYDLKEKKPTALHQKWVENLGNKSILESNINNNIKAHLYEKKKKGYSTSQCKSTNNITTDYKKHFNFHKSVQKRNTEMMVKIIKYFN